MATDIGDLTTLLDQETGLELDDFLLLSLLREAVITFNHASVNQIELTGTTFDRDLNGSEKRILVLFALCTYIRGEIVKSAKVAIIHSNVAGRTELQYVPQELRKLLKDILGEIVTRLNEIDTREIIKDALAVELGETLHITGFPSWGPWWNWRS